jgi:hypothetical protein
MTLEPVPTWPRVEMFRSRPSLNVPPETRAARTEPLDGPEIEPVKNPVVGSIFPVRRLLLTVVI